MMADRDCLSGLSRIYLYFANFRLEFKRSGLRAGLGPQARFSKKHLIFILALMMKKTNEELEVHL